MANAATSPVQQLASLRCQTLSLKRDMSVMELRDIADPAVRAAGLLIADLIMLEKHSPDLLGLVVSVENEDAGRYGVMAVKLYREVISIRSKGKLRMFEKKRMSRIRSLSGFGLEALFDELSQMRNLI